MGIGDAAGAQHGGAGGGRHPQPTLVADVPGTYVAQLVVHDGTVASAPASVSIEARLHQPGFAYVTSDFPTIISVFSIVDEPADPNRHGALEEIAASPFDVENAAQAIAVHPSERFVYVVGSEYYDNRGAHLASISGFARNANTGALTAIPDAQLSTRYASWGVVESSGRFVYVSGFGLGVSGFQIDAATGALTALPGFPLRTGGVWGGGALAVDPPGRFVYMPALFFDALSHTLFGVLFGFRIDAATGALTALPGSPFRAGVVPTALVVDPSGRFIYVASFSAVVGFRIDAATGTLTALPGSPFPSGMAPRAMAIDPSGRFVYVADSPWDDDCDCLPPGVVFGFGIDAATGTLTALAGSPFPLGDAQYPATVALSDQFVYLGVTNLYNYTHYIARYAIDDRTGALTEVFPRVNMDKEANAIALTSR